ncbi:exodeoxyribonuclease I [Pseudoalteromonas aurantia]|uniref:Exodeoxyribonuclease I n=1 Tax=Pseudoalteromonas aurantia TaxID=43654 RepID=A0ABY2W2H3_9GAMM|nr:exodeoxyribonuclease I [Pseudoalteromonas aurantia]TMO54673.1 exodeoxyribonuclease I [Pseudoalteromonas aurantia]TMO78485.1 exodeoxyribonuclease I [Pseudoalteromonas aurantia]
MNNSNDKDIQKNNENIPSIYWHDYETFGATPQKDRPSQFAGIRTDYDLNIIGEPLIEYCKPAPDYLPHPEACLITGITPQHAQKHGLIEAEFMAKIHAQFSRPGTCVAGYNSIRFDDEVTRYSLYRNFYDPYEREWQNGNSRWDIIDLVRACYALRPDGIEWPLKEDGTPSFKLEHLTVANGIEHGAAHDALSDVTATIDLAKLIKTKQPKLFDFFFSLRNKKALLDIIDVFNMQPLVHTSSRIPATQGCTTWIAPMSFHPSNKNAVVCFNLTENPQVLLDLSVEELRERLYTKRVDMIEGDLPVGLKLVHVNKCPILAPAKTLLPENAARLGIDREQCLKHLKVLKEHPELRDKVAEVFNEQGDFSATTNPDYQLYNGFISKSDKAKFAVVRDAQPSALGALNLEFEDAKFTTMLFRYRARNWPELLTPSELDSWRKYCQNKLMHGEDNPSISAEDFMLTLENLVHENDGNEKNLNILKSLYHYAQSL